ncbi:MAG TPA: hypothetical protein PLP50_00155 [Thermoanaerobaculia bacterium]|jgi:hypothetical protein|nr:hypothetical protein [Thermoanaerobaculia bacterium]HPA49982.1 hypothetical protein [Thermoanaerobaculia bacterium]HQN06146.1 hypothetical protein [Thermoanaerobaculia bacterium]HQP85946.1 hypothetical protein [Thermoanaerobaculia bacterium]
MHKRAVSGLLALALVIGCAGVAVAADEPGPLYVQTIQKYRAPVLDDVGGREYKFLIDPAKMKAKPAEAFKDIWKRVRAAAEKNGFEVTEKEKNPFKVELATKEYLDTPDQLLWKAGYQIRVTNKYADGKPARDVAVNVKCVKEDARLAMAAPLAVTGGEKVKIEAEGNVGIGPGGSLREYIEKGATFTVPVEALGKMTLADFGRFVPELLSIGLPADTALVGKKAYSSRVKPGAVVLPGTEPCGVSMEAFSDKEGGAPYLYDFSYGYSDLYFYDIAKVHEAGERFLTKVLHGELAAIAMPESEKWGGSKVRKLMNRPLGAAAVAAGPLVDPLDELYGVASQPAYIKHYEADRDGKVLISPYLQVATKEFPAILDAKMAPYNYVIDAEGRVTIIPEAAHPLGRVYPNGFFRPEDQSEKKPGTRENYGHVSSLAGGPGRISGEILYDKETGTYTVNNKSGRYSKHNKDRTPQQLANAARLIRQVVDTAGVAWGPALYLLEYAPADVREQLMKSPDLRYDDEKKKKRPHVAVLAGAPSTLSTDAPIAVAAAPVAAAAAVEAPKAAAPAAPEKKKAKAAHNDDPS